MSLLLRGLGQPGNGLVTEGLGLTRAESTSAGSGTVYSPAPDISGTGAILSVRAGSTAGAGGGRRGRPFDPKWVEDAWRDELHRIGAGVVSVAAPEVSGTGHVLRASLHGAGGVAAPTPKVSGHGRIQACLMVGAGGTVSREAETGGLANVFDTELEMMLMAAVANG